MKNKDCVSLQFVSFFILICLMTACAEDDNTKRDNKPITQEESAKIESNTENDKHTSEHKDGSGKQSISDKDDVPKTSKTEEPFESVPLPVQTLPHEVGDQAVIKNQNPNGSDQADKTKVAAIDVIAEPWPGQQAQQAENQCPEAEQYGSSEGAIASEAPQSVTIDKTPPGATVVLAKPIDAPKFLSPIFEVRYEKFAKTGYLIGSIRLGSKTIELKEYDKAIHFDFIGVDQIKNHPGPFGKYKSSGVYVGRKAFTFGWMIPPNYAPEDQIATLFVQCISQTCEHIIIGGEIFAFNPKNKNKMNNSFAQFAAVYKMSEFITPTDATNNLPFIKYEYVGYEYIKNTFNVCLNDDFVKKQKNTFNICKTEYRDAIKQLQTLDNTNFVEQTKKVLDKKLDLCELESNICSSDELGKWGAMSSFVEENFKIYKNE